MARAGGAVRRLLPDVVEGSLDDLYTDLDWPPAPDDRPHCYLDMVSSVDGAATIEGRTEQLGGEADHLAFRRLREWCDAILVGASTVRIEGYGPPRPKEDARERRRARGLAAFPTLVVITASVDLDPTARLFADPATRPVVLVPEDADASHLAEVADLIAVGRGRVDLPEAFRLLRERGVGRLLCEGGPMLNAELLRAGLVDELFLTITPTIAGVTAHRIVEGELPGLVGLELRELRTHGSELLLRYGVAG